VNVTFNGNEALLGNGGGIFASDTVMEFTNAVMTFMNNSAANGGAMYADNSNIVMSGSGTFTGNTASSNGGAIYITGGSTMTLEAATGDITFSGNNVNGTPNDVYIESGSVLNINTDANNITLAGGIMSNEADNTSVVNKTGTGTLYLGGNSEIYNTFSSTQGTVALVNGANINAGNLIFNGAAFDMTNSISEPTNYVNTANATGQFTTDTNLAMDVFSNGSNDQIFAGSATVSGNLEIKAHFGVYNSKTYDLIMSSNDIASVGVFTSTTFAYGGGGSNLTYELLYSSDTNNWASVIQLIVSGTNQAGFSNLPNMTFNQTQVAITWDPLSLILADGNDLKNIMEATANLNDAEQEKKVLSIASPYFISNVIRSAAMDNDNNEIYDRIKNHCTIEHTNTAIWGQVTGAQNKYGGDENSLGQYIDNTQGVMAGFDVYFGSNSAISKTMLGIYANYKNHNISQEGSNATLTNQGLGIYGGYIEQGWEVKAMITGTIDKYDTTRNIPLSSYLASEADRNANANFNGNTIGGDVEGALKIGVANNTNFRPYLGIEAKNVSYDSFKETGANGLDVDVNAGNYLRTAGRVGAQIGYDDKTWAGYVGLEGQYLLTGSKYEIQGAFEGTDIDFLSRGYEESGVILGANIGGSVRIVEGLKIFVNGQAYTANKYSNIYGNVGLRYNFCGITHKQKEAQQPQAVAPTPAPVAEPVAEAVPVAQPVAVEQTPEQNDQLAAALTPSPEPVVESTPAPQPVAVQEAAVPVVQNSEAINMDDEKVVKEQVKEAEERRAKPVLERFSLKAALFAVNKATLTPMAKEDLKQMAQKIKKLDYKKITIEGHTDSTGGAKLNKRLSKARARSVFNEFVRHGLDPKRMEYIGFGPTMPTATNKTAAGRAKNRRVEIFVE